MPDPALPLQRRAVLDPNSAEIQSPSSGRHIAVKADGTVFASGIAGTNVAEVWLLVRRLNDASSSANPAGDGFLQAALAGGVWTANNVPGTLTTDRTGNPDNKLVAVLKLTDGTFQAGDVIYFRGRPNQETITVQAKACIWFSFAPDDNASGPGPMGDCEPTVGPHRPEIFIVPANTVLFDLSACGQWRRHPNDPLSSAQGAPPPETRLERPEYRSPAYFSETITDISCVTNMLIGMFLDPFDAPIGEPFPIGQGPYQGVVPGEVHRMVLAFHDGKRWHNNSGEVQATITWTPLQQGFYRTRGRAEPRG